MDVFPMDEVRHGTAGATAMRTALVVLGTALRAALLTLPLLALWAMVRPREEPLSSFSDRQLGDIGLTRDDIARPHERTTSAELEIRRLLLGRGWW